MKLRNSWINRRLSQTRTGLNIKDERNENETSGRLVLVRIQIISFFTCNYNVSFGFKTQALSSKCKIICEIDCDCINKRFWYNF